MSTYKESYQAVQTRLFKLVAFVCILSGCAAAVPLEPKVNRLPTVAQIPLTVGVYYDQAFRTYEHYFRICDYGFDISLGKSSIVLFDEVFPIMFKRVEVVISRPPLPPGGERVAAIIEPKIEEFKLVHPSVLVGTHNVEITYRFTLYTPEGDQIVSSTFMGQGKKCNYYGAFSPYHAPGEATSLAMEEAVEKFMSDFPNLPQVQQWIRQTGGADAK